MLHDLFLSQTQYVNPSNCQVSAAVCLVLVFPYLFWQSVTGRGSSRCSSLDHISITVQKGSGSWRVALDCSHVLRGKLAISILRILQKKSSQPRSYLSCSLRRSSPGSCLVLAPQSDPGTLSWSSQHRQHILPSSRVTCWSVSASLPPENKHHTHRATIFLQRLPFHPLISPPTKSKRITITPNHPSPAKLSSCLNVPPPGVSEADNKVSSLSLSMQDSHQNQ